MSGVFSTISRGIRRLDSRLRQSVEESPAFYITIALAMLIVLFFQNIVELLLQGLFFAAVALLVMSASFLLWVRANYRPSMAMLLAKRSRVSDAIEIARKKYMSRQLPAKAFNRIFLEKQKALIEVEAQIQQMQDAGGRKKLGREVKGVKARRRHVLKSLLQQKKQTLKQLEIAESSYLKRKIDAKTYREMVEADQKKLIELEADILNVYKEDEVEKVRERLRKKLSKKRKKKKKLNRKKREEAMMQSELLSQIKEQE